MTSATWAAVVAVRTDIDGERGLFREIHLVGAKQEEDVGFRQHLGGRLAPLARHEAEVEAADAASCGVQDGKAVPLGGDRADRFGQLRDVRQHREAVGARQAHPGRR